MKQLALLVLICLVAGVSCKNEGSNEIAEEIQAIENGLLPAARVDGDSLTTFNILDRMEYHKVPGVSIAVVVDGRLRWAKGYGIANANDASTVDEQTLFQAGSISKPVAALAVLKLVEEGALALDEDVNKYLVDWKVPDNEFTEKEKVTLRRLLTHTAGMTVHGFPGYGQTDTFPSITEVLNGEGNTPKIFVDTVPGSIWRYSGGGYTVMEKVVEDVSGLPFEEYMATKVLGEIGMSNSTYEQPLGPKFQAHASAAYDNQGTLIEGLWHNYPEQAAAGLWTTPADLANYCLEVQQILAGKEHALLSKGTVEEMLTKGKGDWGLGLSLEGDRDSLIFSHGGKNAGFTNSMIAFAHRGDAVIVMTNADNGGRVIEEVLRAISAYYDWGIREQRVVKVAALEKDQLERLPGKYLLDFPVPGIGDYLIDLEIRDGQLYVTDPNNGEINILTATEDSKFIDLVSGDEVAFQMDGDKVGLLWNGRFQFDKIGQ